MITLGNDLKSLLLARFHRLAICFKIERTDGTIFRFTSHDVPLEVDGSTYTPAGGFSVTARRREAGLRDHNVDLVGMITDSAITSNDLRRGLYREAKVTEFVVDWMFPWAGKVVENVYWIGEVKFDGEVWHAEMLGATRWLRQPVGNVFTRTCRHELGDALCGIDLTPGNGWAWSGVTVATVDSDEPRRKFAVASITGSTEKDDDWFNYGRITWTSGDNNGLKAQVKDYTKTGLSIELILPMPDDVSVGDTLTIETGCGKLFQTDCIDKFSNGENFGGFPHTPGTDEAIKTPDAL